MAFYTLLTNIGLAKIAAAVANDEQIQLTNMVLGDGNGNPTTPSADQTGLVRAVYSGAINRLTVDNENPNYVIAELVVPPTVGGWTVHEVGVFDIDGDLIAVGNFPATYKPTDAEGSTRDLVIRMIIQVSNASAISLITDPNIVVATRQWVADQYLLRSKVAGGLTGQVLTKASNNTEEFEWRDPVDVSDFIVDVQPEHQTLAAGQTVVNFAIINSTGIAVYIEGVRLIEGEDFDVTGIAQITLAQSYPDGTKLHAYQNEPIGEIPEASETEIGVARFSTIAELIDGTQSNIAVHPSALKSLLMMDHVTPQMFGAGMAGDITAAVQAAVDTHKKVVIPYSPDGYTIGTVTIDRYGCDIEIHNDTIINITGGGFQRNMTQVTRSTYASSNDPIFDDVYILPMTIRGGVLRVADGATAVSNRVPFMVYTGVGTPPSDAGLGIAKSLVVDCDIRLLGQNSIGVGIHGGWGSYVFGSIIGKDCGYAIDLAPDGTYDTHCHPQEITVSAQIYSCNPVRSNRGLCTNAGERLNLLNSNMQFVQLCSIRSINVVNVDNTLFVSRLHSMVIQDCGRVSVSGSYFQATGDPVDTSNRGIVNVHNCANFVWEADNKVIINSGLAGRTRALYIKTNASNDTVSTKILGGEFLRTGSASGYAIDFETLSTQTFDGVLVEGVHCEGYLSPVSFFNCIAAVKNAKIMHLFPRTGATKFIEGFSKLDVNTLSCSEYYSRIPFDLKCSANASGLQDSCLAYCVPVDIESSAPSIAIEGFVNVANCNGVVPAWVGRKSLRISLVQSAGLSAGASVQATGTIVITAVNI